ncbi:MAG: hypothetical protein WA208_20870 [Thermoanaerobaculia bacterium]
MVAKGVTPGTSVVFFMASRRPAKHYSQFERTAAIVDDADADGAVELQPAIGVNGKDIWCAVDVQSGAYAVARPSGSVLVNSAVMVRPKRDEESAVGVLLLERPWLELLWVQKKEDAWVTSATLGAFAKSDRTKRVLPFETTPAQFQPIRGQKHPPVKFKKGDLIIAIDVVSSEVFVTEVE